MASLVTATSTTVQALEKDLTARLAGALPAFNQQEVSALASAKNVSALLKPTTPVLSLLGTSGKDPAWNDVRRSQGHVGIPLVSAEFVSAIPMMSRLFQSMAQPVQGVHDQSY